MKVYQAINAVQAALAHDGISKARKNQQQGYTFRGIDDIFNALSPLLAKHGLCILPRIVSRQCEERQTAKGGTLFYVTVEAEFDFVCAEDGSKHTIRTYGEAMDSADKATNKAMSAAYKYAALQSFAIPTEGDNDADAQTHELAAKPAAPPATPATAAKAPVPMTIERMKKGIASGKADAVADYLSGLDDKPRAAWMAQLTEGELGTLASVAPELMEAA